MNGDLALVVDSPLRFSQVADRVVTWAGTDSDQINTTSMVGPSTSLVIPERMLHQHGPLYLKKTGPDLVAFNVPDSRTVLTIGNGDSVARDPNLELDREITFSVSRIEGNTYEFQFKNSPGRGDMIINWGDFRSPEITVKETTKVEKVRHTYARTGTYRLTMSSADGFTKTESWIKVPFGAGLSDVVH